MSNIVIEVPTAAIEKMKKMYQSYFKPTTPPGAVFAAKKNNVNITAYRSGKVLFQGAQAENEANQWTSYQKKTTASPIKKSSPTIALPNGFASWSVLGSDEVGTGSYFGPLTVVAAYVAKEQIPLLKELGVRDSKDLKDPQIIAIAKDLLTFLPHSLLNVMPEKYNQIQPAMSQGKMKAILHNQALKHVLDKIEPVTPEAILIDQFELPKTYFAHISDQQFQVKEKVYFATKGEQHHLAVAAASILARYSFLKGLDQLTEDAGFKIPSGAGGNVDIVAARLIKRGGTKLLGHYAKLHFANTEKAMKIANK